MTDPVPRDPTEETIQRPSRSASAPGEEADDARSTLPLARGGASPERVSPSAGRPFGRYRLLEELGRGGMGVVWKAWDGELQRIVALKLIRAGADSGPLQEERFLREARLAAKLAHPGIVPVFDVGAAEGQSYYTSELVPGRSLAEETTRPVDPRRAAGWVRALAEALDYAHSQGVVHRDVKPGNVLMDPSAGGDPRPRLTDFGLARGVPIGPDDEEPLAPLTVTGDVIGTPVYMSPELARGESSRAGPASDQFSLGVVLYQLLTGRLPFERASLVDVLRAIIDDDPPRPTTVDPSIPGGLETICLKAMQKEPSSRYDSAGELAADLGRWLAGESIVAKPAGWIQRALRRTRRNRALAFTALSAAVLVATLCGKLVVDWRTRIARVEDGLAAAARWEEAGDRASPDDFDRRADAYRRAREEAVAVLRIEEHNEVAKGIETRAARRIGEVDAARTVAAEREALRKGNLVSNVLTRWALLTPVLQRLDGILSDATLGVEAKKDAIAREWEGVQRFIVETPADPTSQGTMWPLAGLARSVAGDAREGREWIRKGRDLDPDLPFGALVEALTLSLDYLRERSLPPVLVEEDGVCIAFPADEGPVLRETRRQAEALVHEAGNKRVWGQERASGLRALLDAMRRIYEGDFAGAEAALGRASASPELKAVEPSLLFLRSFARYHLGDFEGAMEDLDALCAVRRNAWELWYGRSMVGCVRADKLLERDEDPIALVRDALRDAERALALAPGNDRASFARGQALVGLCRREMEDGVDPRPRAEQALKDLAAAEDSDACGWTATHLRGLAWNLIGKAELEEGLDATPSHAKALEAIRAAVSAQPDRTWIRKNLGIVLLDMADAEARSGRDARASLREAISCFDVEIERDPGNGAALLVRGIAWQGLGTAEALWGEDPQASFQRALLDYEHATGAVRRTWQPMVKQAEVLCYLHRRDEGLALLDRALSVCTSEPEKARIRDRKAELAAGPMVPWIEKARTAYAAVEADDYALARVLYEEALAEAGESAEKDPALAECLRLAYVDLACIYALRSDGLDAPGATRHEVAPEEAARRRDTAFSHMSKAMDLGWRDPVAMRDDPNLAPIRGDPRFKELLERAER